MLIRRQVFSDDSGRVDWIVCFRCIFPSVFLLSGNSRRKENKDDCLAAGVFYSWNPYLAERLVMGQWAMLLGYAGLPWVLPSPNMPTAETALVYPGGCLIEGTNLSEGRGTTAPFQLVGAPFLILLNSL